MSKEGGNGGKGPSMQVRQVKINLNEVPTVGCPNCGYQLFATNVAMYKKLSAIQVGKPMLAKIEIAICQDCGAVVQPVDDELRLVEVAMREGEEGQEDNEH